MKIVAIKWYEKFFNNSTDKRNHLSHFIPCLTSYVPTGLDTETFAGPA